MTKLEELEQRAYETDIVLLNRYISKEAKALSIKEEPLQVIILDKEKFTSDAEETCTLAEEIAHFETDSFYHFQEDYNNPVNKQNIAKAEERAKRHAIRDVLPCEDIQRALDKGYTEQYELADFLGVTIDFLCKAFEIYQVRGIFFNFGDTEYA